MLCSKRISQYEFAEGRAAFGYEMAVLDVHIGQWLDTKFLEACDYIGKAFLALVESEA